MSHHGKVEERVASFALAAFAISRVFRLNKGKVGGMVSLAAAAMLVKRTLTGHSGFYRALFDEQTNSSERNLQFKHSVAIRRSKAEIMKFLGKYRSVSTLANYIPYLSVSKKGGTHCSIHLPMGQTVELDFAGASSTSDSGVAFRSLGKSERLQHQGKITLKEDAHGLTTVELEINLKSGQNLLTSSLSGPFLAMVDKIVEEGLKLLKTKMETGRFLATPKDDNSALSEKIAAVASTATEQLSQEAAASATFNAQSTLNTSKGRPASSQARLQ